MAGPFGASNQGGYQGPSMNMQQPQGGFGGGQGFGFGGGQGFGGGFQPQQQSWGGFGGGFGGFGGGFQPQGFGGYGGGFNPYQGGYGGGFQPQGYGGFGGGFNPYQGGFGGFQPQGFGGGYNPMFGGIGGLGFNPMMGQNFGMPMSGFGYQPPYQIDDGMGRIPQDGLTVAQRRERMGLPPEQDVAFSQADMTPQMRSAAAQNEMLNSSQYKELTDKFGRTGLHTLDWSENEYADNPELSAFKKSQEYQQGMYGPHSNSMGQAFQNWLYKNKDNLSADAFNYESPRLKSEREMGRRQLMYGGLGSLGFNPMMGPQFGMPIRGYGLDHQ